MSLILDSSQAHKTGSQQPKTGLPKSRYWHIPIYIYDVKHPRSDLLLKWCSTNHRIYQYNYNFPCLGATGLKLI